MLNGKQKRYLRGIASKEKAIFQIGKDGLTENLYNALNDALEARELVKISVLKTCELEINEIEIELLSKTHSELVRKIGHTIILYKKSKERKIILP